MEILKKNVIQQIRLFVYMLCSHYVLIINTRFNIIHL